MKYPGLIFLFFFILGSCDEINTVTVSLTDEFAATGNGKMVTTVEKEGDELQLEGELELIYGIFTVCLTNPSADTLFLNVFDEPGKFTVDEKFTRELGDWTFYYTIEREGNTNPSGNFDFDLIFKN